MRTVFLDRVREYDSGTYGILSIDGRPFCLTLEPLWKDNQRNVSCIPPGKYICIAHTSPRFGQTFLVTNVLNRSDILFHWGNFPRDTEGCVIVGGGFSRVLSEQMMLLESRSSFREFLARMGKKSFELVIQGVPR